MKIRSFGLALSLALTPALSVHAAHFKLRARVSTPVQGPMVGRFTVLPAKHFDQFATDAQAAAGTTVPQWARTVTTAGVHYTYRMVGRNPFVAQTTQTTNIKAVIIPMKLVYQDSGNATFDPTKIDPACLPGRTAAGLVKTSPLFNAVAGYPGGTYVGTGEYVDLFQRANYYSQTQSGGLNPNYHVNLVYSTAAEITVTVTGTGGVMAGTCGNIGLVDIGSWDNFLQSQIFPALASASPKIAPPNTLPIFLLYNVVLTSGGSCCILGYHSAFNDPAYGGAFHTYSSVEFDSNRSFNGVSDISAMSHEIAEWMDDPSGGNPTPTWGNIGQVSGCQGNLEVGDPLSGTLTQIYMPNGYTYHVQDLAFTSWFYRQHPSTGVNGWYSFLGSFLTPAAACP